ncbi:unnamed protein product [Ascophyllum nodosum]
MDFTLYTLLYVLRKQSSTSHRSLITRMRGHSTSRPIPDSNFQASRCYKRQETSSRVPGRGFGRRSKTGLLFGSSKLSSKSIVSSSGRTNRAPFRHRLYLVDIMKSCVIFIPLHE